MPKLLLIEDDRRIVDSIEKALSILGGFTTEWVSDPDKAVTSAMRFKPDLILLDIRLPGGDGRAVLKALKSNVATREAPVIFLTGMSSEGDKVVGLNLGADDYVVKPFGAMELTARISAVLRRYQPQAGASGVIEAGGLSLDPKERAARIDGRPLSLQPKEFEILLLLASNPGRCLSRAFLIENSSSYGLPLLTRSLDTHIKNLRKKLGRSSGLIQTVSKLGYRLTP
ncbi:MAG: response regulator transcription factor [Elusimicrobia bacterium]|nr:response regulator transcription factor [Elusimicrobiota bacterium]